MSAVGVALEPVATSRVHGGATPSSKSAFVSCSAPSTIDGDGDADAPDPEGSGTRGRRRGRRRGRCRGWRRCARRGRAGARGGCGARRDDQQVLDGLLQRGDLVDLLDECARPGSIGRCVLERGAERVRRGRTHRVVERGQATTRLVGSEEATELRHELCTERDLRVQLLDQGAHVGCSERGAVDLLLEGLPRRRDLLIQRSEQGDHAGIDRRGDGRYHHHTGCDATGDGVGVVMAGRPAPARIDVPITARTTTASAAPTISGAGPRPPWIPCPLVSGIGAAVSLTPDRRTRRSMG